MDISGAAQTLVRALAAYVVLVFFIRVSGARTLAKMNAFDLVVTVALGSLLATTILSPSAPLWRGILAMGALVALQWVVARASVASDRFRRLVSNEPIRVYHRDGFDEAAMRRARVTRSQVESAVRNAGYADVHAIAEVRLETSGRLSVIDKGAA